MELKTKFNINDEIWFFNDGNIPQKAQIKNINIVIAKLPRLMVNIKYELVGIKNFSIHEESLFETQAELYASLEN